MCKNETGDSYTKFLSSKSCTRKRNESNLYLSCTFPCFLLSLMFHKQIVQLYPWWIVTITLEKADSSTMKNRGFKYTYQTSMLYLLYIFTRQYQYILVKVPVRVHYGKYCSRPRPSVIFPVVHESTRYFSWFIV